MDNTNEDFKVIISDLDQSTVLVTERDEQMSVDDMWKQILETSVYNFQTKKHQYSTIINNSSSGTADNITVENIEEYAGALIKYNNIVPVVLFFFWLFMSEPVCYFVGFAFLIVVIRVIRDIIRIS